jgi:two-component system response regulator YesN
MNIADHLDVSRCLVHDSQRNIFAALRNIIINACTQNAISSDQYRKQSITDYINTNFTDPDFSVSKMAEDINLSPNYLSAQFRTLFNTTIISYVTSMRIELAAELLSTTDLSINEIALKCGFSGSDTLNRSFKRKFHITPSKYRGSYKS